MLMQTDEELVRSARLGRRDAFESLVGRYERVVWVTARRILGDDHAAWDAAQEAFLQAYRRLHALREPSLFAGWLLRIARREANRMARRQARHPTRPLDERGDDRPSSADHGADGFSADSEELLAAIADLPDHERSVVVLRYVDGRSVAEIAAACGRPVGTVTKQLSRALERLRLTLKEVIS
jgi:RNA polymerase sigma-70 factor, ECF subfamily